MSATTDQRITAYARAKAAEAPPLPESAKAQIARLLAPRQGGAR